MADDDFFLELIEFYVFESGSHSLDDNWEILSPGDLLLSDWGVGEVDEEHLIVFECVLGVERRPDLMVVGPSL